MTDVNDKKIPYEELEEEASKVTANASDVTPEFEDGSDETVCSADFSSGCTE